MGLIDITQFLTSRIEAIPALQPHVEIYRLGLETRSVLEAERESNLQVQSQLQEEIRQLEAQLEYERSQWALERANLERERLQLDQRERQLQILKSTLDAQMENLKSLETLRNIYSEMRAADVIPILNELDDGVVAHILIGMDERSAAAILRAMEPNAAARISHLIGGLSSK